MIFVFLFMTYFTKYYNNQFHPCCWNQHYFIVFYVWVVFYCIYVPLLLYPFIKAIYRFSAIPIKLPMVFFYRTTTKNLKICETPNSQSYLEKEKQNWRNQVPWLQTTLQTYSDQNSIVLVQKEWNIDHWKRIESLQRNPCSYCQLIYNRGGKTIRWRKDSLFNKQCWENWTATCKRMELEHSNCNITHKNKLKLD